jgi:hypothetical protein
LEFRTGADSGNLTLQPCESEEQARASFAISGNEFVAPKASIRDPRKPVVLDPPLISDESLPDLGDENFLWRGYPNNQRGVIKFRVGRIIGQVNAPNVEDAERITREAVELLRNA